MGYVRSGDPEDHIALVCGDIRNRDEVLVRMHAHCAYGDIFGSSDCDCRAMMEQSMELISRAGAGVLVYLHQTGPGLRYQRENNRQVLVPHSRDSHYVASVDHQRRLQHEAGLGAQILSDLGLHRIRLLTNHPRKIVGLEAYGVEITEQIAVALPAEKDCPPASPYR